MSSGKNRKNDYAAELEERYARWDYVHEHGCSDPCWSDGVNANLLRNQIIYCKQKIRDENTLFLLPDCFYREIPPELPNNFMARSEEIRANANKAMAIIDADENLKFVREQSKNLTEKQLQKLYIPAILNYPENLRRAIAEDDLIAMRRYENPESFLKSFESAANKLRSQEVLQAAESQPIIDETEEDFEEDYSETERSEPEKICEPESEPEEYFQMKLF